MLLIATVEASKCLNVLVFLPNPATTMLYTLSYTRSSDLQVVLDFSARASVSLWWKLTRLQWRETVKSVVSFQDRKSTRLNSSRQIISYAVFCLKKKNTEFKTKRDAPGPRERPST